MFFGGYDKRVFLPAKLAKKGKKFSNAGLMRVAFTPGYIHTIPDSYNPGQNSWDTNAIARQIEASSLLPSPSVQC